MARVNALTVISSRLWTADSRDWLKGLIITVIGAVLGLVVEAAQELLKTKGSLRDIEWGTILIAAIIAGSSYVLKKFSEPAKQVTVVEPQVVEKIKVREAESPTEFARKTDNSR